MTFSYYVSSVANLLQFMIGPVDEHGAGSWENVP